MKLKTLIHEPAYDRVLDILIDVAFQQGFEFSEPTPLISPFWKTTFTPSSSEAIFRHLDKLKTSSDKFYTIQPCIRINDLPHLSDGWHCLLFHMVSFFLLDVTNIEEALSIILKAMVSATNLNLSDFYFTVPTNQYCPTTLSQESLGADLLEKIGVSSEQMIWCAGSDNYQDNSLVTAEGQKVSMTGPKVEIFVKLPHQEKLYEVATCVLETAKCGDSSFGNVFACAIGLERLVAISEGQTSIAEMQKHQDLVNIICKSLLHPSMATISLGKEAVEQLLFMIDALAYIGSHKDTNVKHDRGIRNHHSRIFKTLCRSLKSLGISEDDFINLTNAIMDRNFKSAIDLIFLRMQIKDEAVGYV